MRTDVVREEVTRLIHQRPFRPFVFSLENGDRVTIDHPENIAFEPKGNGTPGSLDFYVLSSRLRY